MSKLRYTGDTILMLESKEELKSLLIRWKRRVKRADLKLNVQKTKIMASSPIISWQIKGEKMEAVTDFIFLDFKIPADSNCSHEIKRCLLLGRKAMTNLDSVLKSRDITLLTKVHMIKAMFFPVAMYGCESWTIKKAECWCFWIVLEKILDSLLDCKAMSPVNPQRNPPWIFIGRIDSEAPILWPPDVKSRLIRKDSDAAKDWR